MSFWRRTQRREVTIIILSLPAGWKVMRRPKTITVNVYIVNIQRLLLWDWRRGCLRAGLLVRSQCVSGLANSVTIFRGCTRCWSTQTPRFAACFICSPVSTKLRFSPVLSQQSAVGVGTGIRAECLQRQESILKINQTLSGAQWVRGLFSGSKAAGTWSWPPSVKVKNEWSHTSAPHICFHGFDRDNFALHGFPQYSPHPHQRYYNSVYRLKFQFSV